MKLFLLSRHPVVPAGVFAAALFTLATLNGAEERWPSAFKITTTPASGAQPKVVKVETPKVSHNRYQAFEDPNIGLTRVLVRVTSTCGGEPKPGRWFKLMGRESPVHRFTITDCVFATAAEPRSGWRVLNFPKDATYRGTNYVLLLGEPGGYRAEVPAGIKFLEGQAAKAKWHEVRNQWLIAHGYEPRGPDDWDPMQAPVAAPRRPVTKPAL
jgi:hypothetical protein